jgi:hypothetical protein
MVSSCSPSIELGVLRILYLLDSQIGSLGISYYPPRRKKTMIERDYTERDY